MLAPHPAERVPRRFDPRGQPRGPHPLPEPVAAAPRRAPGALRVASSCPTLLAGTAVLLVLALAGGLVRWPLAPRPPLPSVPWFTSLALLATLVLGGPLLAQPLGVSAFDPPRVCCGASRPRPWPSRWWPLVLLAVAFDLALLSRAEPRPGRGPAHRRARPWPWPCPWRFGPARAPSPAARARWPPSPCGRSGASSSSAWTACLRDLLKDALARGAQPVFARLHEARRPRAPRHPAAHRGPAPLEHHPHRPPAPRPRREELRDLPAAGLAKRPTSSCPASPS